MVDPVLDPSHDIVYRGGHQRCIPERVADRRHDVLSPRSRPRAGAELRRLGQRVVGQVSPRVCFVLIVERGIVVAVEIRAYIVADPEVLGYVFLILPDTAGLVVR